MVSLIKIRNFEKVNILGILNLLSFQNLTSFMHVTKLPFRNMIETETPFHPSKGSSISISPTSPEM